MLTNSSSLDFAIGDESFDMSATFPKIGTRFIAVNSKGKTGDEGEPMGIVLLTLKRACDEGTRDTFSVSPHHGHRFYRVSS